MTASDNLAALGRGLKTFAGDVAEGFFEITHNGLALLGVVVVLAVADLAAREGITLDWKRHALTGLPVTLLSLGLVWLFA